MSDFVAANDDDTPNEVFSRGKLKVFYKGETADHRYFSDAFAEKLSGLDIHYVHPIKEHAWGQRVVRFFDPDGHIIEVGENVKTVCRRFLDSEMSPEQVAERMDVPLKFVKGCMR